jgi:hypothetical protein
MAKDELGSVYWSFSPALQFSPQFSPLSTDTNYKLDQRFLISGPPTHRGAGHDCKRCEYDQLKQKSYLYKSSAGQTILSRLGATYKTGFGFDDWIYCTLFNHTFRDYRQYSAIAVLHTFQLTVANALGISAFTSRILATGSSQSHCNFKSHMKSSWHSLIPFLPFLLNHIQNKENRLKSEIHVHKCFYE